MKDHETKGYSAIMGQRYAKKGFVFVEDGIEDFDCVLRKDADPKKIIRCSQCRGAAYRLDHFYPYHQEQNTCRRHEKS